MTDNFNNQDISVKRVTVSNGENMGGYKEYSFNEPTKATTTKFIILLILSILEICMCCPSCFTTLCGIIALIFVLLANSAYKVGDINKYNTCNAIAIIFLIIGGILLLISLIIKFIIGKTTSFVIKLLKKLF